MPKRAKPIKQEELKSAPTPSKGPIIPLDITEGVIIGTNAEKKVICKLIGIDPQNALKYVGLLQGTLLQRIFGWPSAPPK